MHEPTSRRSFLKSAAFGAAALGAASTSKAADPPKIQGFEQTPSDPKTPKQWTPVSDRKIRKVIRAGAATTSEVGRACGAGSCCGGCVGIIDELITSERASHEAVTTPSSPTTDRPRL